MPRISTLNSRQFIFEALAVTLRVKAGRTWLNLEFYSGTLGCHGGLTRWRLRNRFSSQRFHLRLVHMLAICLSGFSATELATQWKVQWVVVTQNWCHRWKFRVDEVMFWTSLALNLAADKTFMKKWKKHIVESARIPLVSHPTLKTDRKQLTNMALNASNVWDLVTVCSPLGYFAIFLEKFQTYSDILSNAF